MKATIKAGSMPRTYPFSYQGTPGELIYDPQQDAYFVVGAIPNTPVVRPFPVEYSAAGELTASQPESYINTAHCPWFTTIRTAREAVGGEQAYGAYAFDALHMATPYPRLIAAYLFKRLTASDDLVVANLPQRNLEDYTRLLPWETVDREAIYMRKGYQYSPTSFVFEKELPTLIEGHEYILAAFDTPQDYLMGDKLKEDELKIPVPASTISALPIGFHSLRPLQAYAYADVGTDNWAKPMPYAEETCFDDCNDPPRVNGYTTPKDVSQHQIYFNRYDNQWSSGGSKWWGVAEGLIRAFQMTECFAQADRRLYVKLPSNIAYHANYTRW